jgi:hypothetical protein
MVALTLLEDIGVFAGFIIFAFLLVLILRPLSINVTVRHDSDHGSDTEEERDATTDSS